MLTLCMVLFLQDPLPADAKTIVEKADVKIEQLRKAFEEAVARVKAQEVKDLQRIHDSIKKGDPAGAVAVKVKIDQLSADVNAVLKGASSVEQWLQGKWTVTLGGAGDVIEFRGTKVIGSGIGDRTRGKAVIEGGSIQIVWESGYVETMRAPKDFGDEATGTGRSGAQIFKRLK